MLVGVGIDVSALKAAQDALRQFNSELEQHVRERTRELQATNAQLMDTQFALDSIGIGITWADFVAGCFIYASRFAAEFLGYSVDELLQRRVWDIDPNFPPEAFAQVAREIRQRGHLQFETEQRTKDDRRLPVEMTVYQHAGNGITPPKLVAFMSDIKHRKEAEAALRRAKEASEAANAAKGEFLANMSHEIRTPLNAILGLNFLLKKEDPSPAQLERLSKMEVAGRHLLLLVNDILDLSKIEAGWMDLEHSNFHLSAVLDYVASIVRDAAVNKGLTLEVDTNGVPLWLWGEVGLHSTPGLGSTFWFRVPTQHGHGPILTPTAMADDAESHPASWRTRPACRGPCHQCRGGPRDPARRRYRRSGRRERTRGRPARRDSDGTRGGTGRLAGYRGRRDARVSPPVMGRTLNAIRPPVRKSSTPR